MKDSNKYIKKCIRLIPVLFLGILFLSIIVFSLCSCKQSPSIRFATSYDLLSEIASNLHSETQAIQFGKDAHPEEYLLRGWSFSEAEHTWANARESSLTFYAYNTKDDLVLKLVAWTLPSSNHAQQLTEVSVNGESVGTMSIPTVPRSEISFTLPASALQFGQNILQFHFTYLTKPDGRDLSVAFQQITFRPTTTLKYQKDIGLVQQGNSTFQYFVPLPQQLELDIEYENLTKASVLVEIIGEQGKNTKFKLSSGKKFFRKSVTLEQRGVYKLRLTTNGTPDTNVVWKRFSLNIPESGQEAPTLGQGGAKTDNTPESGQETPTLGQGFSKTDKPDIVLYVVDALRADHLSCYGYSRKTSPNLDQFAAENALFPEAYATSSWTRASGASIVTGLLPKNHKTMRRDDRLQEELVTIGEILEEHGYYTAAFVVNANLAKTFGFGQGFTEFHQLFDPDPETAFISSAGVNEKVFTFLDKYVARQNRKPLFLLIWTVDPHDPYMPPRDVRHLFNIEQYEPTDANQVTALRRPKTPLTESQLKYVETLYDQEIYFNDTSFGHLLQKLQRLQIYNDACIFFTADHGEEFADHGGFGHGLTLYNEQVKIPFVLKIPHIAQGVYDQPVQISDIYPTILDIIGVSPPYQLDGLSLLLPLPAKRVVYFEEELDRNDLTARLDQEKTVIFNKTFNRPPSPRNIPFIEFYKVEDYHQQKPLEKTGFTDAYRIQELLFYRDRESSLGLQQVEGDVSPELDQRLRDLGYVK